MATPATTTTTMVINWRTLIIVMNEDSAWSRQGHCLIVQVTRKVSFPLFKYQSYLIYISFVVLIHHKEGKRRRNNLINNSSMSKSSIEQCEKEIHRLQSSVDILRQKLEESELKETSDSVEAIARQSDTKIRSIISR